MVVVYRHLKKTNNEVFYVGIGENISRAYKKSGRNKYWHNVVKKHNYIVEILIDNISYNDAETIEIGLIEYYGRKDLGTGNLVNLTNGADGTRGHKHTEATRKNLSDIGKGRVAWNKGISPSKETCEKISKKLIGNKNGVGYAHSKETKLKISSALINKSPTKEIIEIRKKGIIESYKNRGMYWSENDINIIFNNYQTHSDRELHEEFFKTRTYNSVRSMRIKLNIKRRK